MRALNANDDVEFTALCTAKPESAEAARQAHGAKLAFHGYPIQVAPPEIDTVSVVVRVPSHYGRAKTAIEAGKHVYCEWPLGRTAAGTDAIGAILAVRIRLMREGVVSGPSNRAWQRDRSLRAKGGNTLQPLTVSDGLTFAPTGAPDTEAMNGGQM